MILNECDPNEDFEEIEAILMKIGFLYQLHDDYLDAFVDSNKTGKIGSDIPEGKCCWPIVRALQLCDERQRIVLENNYGIKSEANVKAVKEVYKELNLIKLFKHESTQMYGSICADIQRLNDKRIVGPEIFDFIISKIINREK